MPGKRILNGRWQMLYGETAVGLPLTVVHGHIRPAFFSGLLEPDRSSAHNHKGRIPE
jgi:hypothetical protein